MKTQWIELSLYSVFEFYARNALKDCEVGLDGKTALFEYWVDTRKNQVVFKFRQTK